MSTPLPQQKSSSSTSTSGENGAAIRTPWEKPTLRAEPVSHTAAGGTEFRDAAITFRS